jgi:hypothetical protein
MDILKIYICITLGLVLEHVSSAAARLRAFPLSAITLSDNYLSSPQFRPSPETFNTILTESNTLLIPRIAKQIPQSCLRLAVEVTVSCQF